MQYNYCFYIHLSKQVLINQPKVNPVEKTLPKKVRSESKMSVSTKQILETMDHEYGDVVSFPVDLSRMVMELIAIGNSAKNIGWYFLANLVFARLLALALIGEARDVITFVLETGDHDGSSPLESYYDLLTLKTTSESICIPLPLISPLWSFAALKAVRSRGVVVDRGEHNRSRHTANVGEAEELKKRLQLLLKISDWPAFEQEAARIILFEDVSR